MRKNNLIFSSALLFLLLNSSKIHCFFSSLPSDNSDAIILTNENFYSKTKQYDVLLVMFHVNWCSHCRRLQPEYNRASTILLQNVDYPIHLAKLDCTDDDEAQCGRRYSIDGYPTLRIYRYGRFNGEELNYHNRTTDELVKTMKALKKGSRQQESTTYSTVQVQEVNDEMNKDSGQQESTSYSSVQIEGVKDEMIKATASVQHMSLFVGLFMILCKSI